MARARAARGAAPARSGRRLVLLEARRWHGFYFSWAIVYTFWFHPAEATTGHLVGFFSLLLVLLQGSVFFTKVHVNRWWTLLLEVLVVAHGTAVALDQRHGMAPMFFFGFSALFVVTQVHGLSWPLWARAGVALAWLAGVGIIYSQRPLARLEEVARIPLADYLGVLILTALLWAGSLITRSGSPAVAPDPRAAPPTADDSHRA